jgi:hypothetical protein
MSEDDLCRQIVQLNASLKSNTTLLRELQKSIKDLLEIQCEQGARVSAIENHLEGKSWNPKDD